MNPLLQRLMQSATRLVRGGDLKAATAEIQAALAGNAPHPVRAEPHPVRAEHNPVRAEPHPVRAEPVEAQRTAGSSAEVIDVVARELPQVDTERPPTSKGRFNDGTYTDAAGQQRDYKLYLPPDASDHPRPLVVMLHGCTQDAGDFALGTAMNELARAHGFFVLYPEQSMRANPQRCWNWFKHSHQVRDRGEPALLAGMTREVMAANAIDPARVYVAGLSAGGAMAAILGDVYPDIFAAVGVHSGLATGLAKDLPSAFGAMKGAPRIANVTPSGIPTIVFHGDADTTVHPGNGAHVIAASVHGGADVEVENGVAAGGRDYTRGVHRAPDGRVVAEHWVVHGAPHAWSGGSSAGTYTDPRGPDASAEMVRFFLEHRR